MMAKKIKFMVVFIVALCMILGMAVYGVDAAEVTGDTVITPPDMATVIDPETGEILQAAPRLGGEDGYEGIMPISGEILPISDEMLEGNEPLNPVIQVESVEEEEDNNVWIWVGAGAGIIVLIGIVVVLMKKQ